MPQLSDSAEFTFAQLSMAAYANLFAGISGTPYTDALVAAGFTEELAGEFAAQYIVLDQQPNTGSGFSASLFQQVDSEGNPVGSPILAIRGTEFTVADLATDALIGLFGTTTFLPQYDALTAYYERLITPTDQQTSSGVQGLGLLAANGQIVATGHSLGGFLAAAFAGDTSLHPEDAGLGFNSGVTHAYTYNAPGTGGVLAQLLQLVGILPSSIPNAQVTNINAENGLSLIAGLGIQQGTVENVFIEEGSALHNHSVITLTDSLAEYDLFGRIDNGVSLPTITNILNAESAIPNRSLENTIIALQKLFQNTNVTVDTDNRDQLYTQIRNLETSIAPDGQPFLNGADIVIDLTTLSADVLVSRAENDVAIEYRYALTELNPFVILGANYGQHDQNGELDRFNVTTGVGTLTDQYIQDRAEFLADKIAFNIIDGVSPVLPFPNIHFKDFASGYEIVPASAAQEILFGGNAGDSLPGGDGADYLFGGVGNDTITGGSGDDYLEGDQGNDTLAGGAGYDTYIYNIGDGQDTISDSGGAIVYDTHPVEGGIHRTTDAPNTYRGGDQGAMTFIWDGPGTDLTINNLITVQNFQNGNLEIDRLDGWRNILKNVMERMAA